MLLLKSILAGMPDTKNQPKTTLGKKTGNVYSTQVHTAKNTSGVRDMLLTTFTKGNTHSRKKY